MTLLVLAKNVIRRATHQVAGLSRFTPRWMLIATWYQVGYYNSHADLVILEIVFCIFVEHERYPLYIHMDIVDIINSNCTREEQDR